MGFPASASISTGFYPSTADVAKMTQAGSQMDLARAGEETLLMRRGNGSVRISAKRMIKLAISLLYFISRELSQFVLSLMGRSPKEQLMVAAASRFALERYPPEAEKQDILNIFGPLL
ncbi:hypothetical protein ABIB90_007471 [Bradyrhizobium sp. JR4.1]|uniref:hypothetical protein n=1 Tax=unclassified Bradyrhizobium TaxID=2631580 RepID=UPI0033922E0C